MAGTKEGGIKAALTNKKRYGKNYYETIGTAGGKKSQGGFGTDTIGKDGLTGRERAKIVGSVGGKKSRRTKLETRYDERVGYYAIND